MKALFIRFLLARKNELFKELRKLNIHFYDSNYIYNCKNIKPKKNNYVKKTAMVKIMRKYRNDSIQTNDSTNTGLQDEGKEIIMTMLESFYENIY